MTQPKYPFERSQRGFTLIELMITLVVIGVLSAIAIPSYNEYVQRGHRSNGRTALVATQHWLERAATAQGQYPAALPSGLVSVEGKRYSLTYVVSANQDAYTLTATPVTAQYGDKCGGIVMTNTGAKSVTGTLPASECWTQ